MLSKDSSRSLIDWTPINGSIIKARFHSKHIKLTIIHVYAQTEVSHEDLIEEFYIKLQEVIDDVH